MPKLDLRAGTIALSVAVLLTLAIIIGSRNLRDFDAALIGYATATVFAALGVTYRFVLWLSRPPTRLYWARGWQLFASWRNFRRYGWLIPQAIIGDIAVQNFILPRGIERWIMHFCLFWGVILASAITFPLVFGWIRFHLVGTADYQLLVVGIPILTFPVRAALGFLIFHFLDVTAILVIIGVAIALWRRWTDRGLMPEQEFGFDFLPLFLLLAISVSGLLLTASSMLWAGSFYWFIALAHQGLVILAILYIPFGKFWHVLERPASVGIRLYKQVTTLTAGRACVRCGRTFAAEQFVEDLKQTLRDLNQDYSMGPQGQWLQDYCPECKRMLRANTYFARVQREFL
ncbi:MAG: MFS transporter [Chloroflexi bacterium]|nr:MFS transporter [Chloroflexota bacterium]